MRKRIQLNYEVVKSSFDASLEAADASSYFRISGGTEPETIVTPTSLMHRLFRLGQAYGIRHLRYLEPEVKIIVGTFDLPDFLRDLRRLLSLVNDEVLHELICRLILSIEAPPGVGSKHVAVSTGRYYEKRV